MATLRALLAVCFVSQTVCSQSTEYYAEFNSPVSNLKRSTATELNLSLGAVVFFFLHFVATSVKQDKKKHVTWMIKNFIVT